MIDIYTQVKWHRYIGREVLEFENKSEKIVLKNRALFGLFEKNGSWYIVGEPLSEDQLVVCKFNTNLLAKVLSTAKPYIGKILGKSVSGLPKDISEVKEKTTMPEPVLSKMPGAKDIELVPITAEQSRQDNIKGSGKHLIPSDRLFEQVVKAASYLGLKVAFKHPVVVATSQTEGTCLKGVYNKIRGSYDIRLIINPKQLQRIFGVISVPVLAQVITHELAHYIMLFKVMRQSDVAKFKKAIAAKMVHKNQFDHPGYGYPWWQEAWAILCEAMVHGQSCRGFSTPIGYELAEKYFVNNYLKQGKYTGSTDSV